MTTRKQTVLAHVGAGVGNVVLATPLFVALAGQGFTIDVLLDADYAETAELLRGWSLVREVFAHGAGARPAGWRDYDHLVPAVPPFYWHRFARLYAGDSRAVARPPDALFYADEQQFYLSFARSLGAGESEHPVYRLPVAPDESFGVGARTLVIAPGSKGGEMRAKRWGGFVELAGLFADVAVVGTREDLRGRDGAELKFPPHARLFVDRLSLAQTAGLLAAAGAVVGNDCGLSHVAAAVGAPTVMIFGATPHLALGRLAPNVRVVRAGLPCEPCWFASRFRACDERIDCLRAITVEGVAREVRELLCADHSSARDDTSLNHDCEGADSSSTRPARRTA
jgi:ADP-heptose:LPS heptosyltransferase